MVSKAPCQHGPAQLLSTPIKESSNSATARQMLRRKPTRIELKPEDKEEVGASVHSVRAPGA